MGESGRFSFQLESLYWVSFTNDEGLLEQFAGWLVESDDEEIVLQKQDDVKEISLVDIERCMKVS